MSPQRQGITFQHQICHTLLKAFPHLSSRDIFSSNWMERGADIILSSAAKACLPFNIECKYTKKASVRPAWKQARRRKGYQPLVILQCSSNAAMPHPKIPDRDWLPEHKPIAAVLLPTLSRLVAGDKDRFKAIKAKRINLYKIFADYSYEGYIHPVVILEGNPNIACISLDHFLTYQKRSLE